MISSIGPHAIVCKRVSSSQCHSPFVNHSKMRCMQAWKYETKLAGKKLFTNYTRQYKADTWEPVDKVMGAINSKIDNQNTFNYAQRKFLVMQHGEEHLKTLSVR